MRRSAHSSRARLLPFPPMLELKDIDVAIGPVSILRGVGFSIPRGAMFGLVGRNGAGKTTLLRTIMGLLKPSRGCLRFDGRELTQMPPHRRTSLGIGYAPEDRRLVPDLTVEENLLLPAWALGMKESAARLGQVCEAIPELREFAARRALQLSGGQQKLVAIGRALLSGTELLLLDEPFEG